MIRNAGWMLGAVLGLAALGVWFLSGGSSPPPDRPATHPTEERPLDAPRPTAPEAAKPAGACSDPQHRAGAAKANAATLTTLDWAPFRRREVGWETYAPFIAVEIATACAPADPGFADALSRWQRDKARPPTGVLTPEDFEIMRVASHRRRPFVIAFADGCPAAAEPTTLAAALPEEGYAGKAVSLRRDALDAYRAMVKAARREDPAIAADPRFLTIFSAYRGPVEEAARCVGRDCTGVTRAACSAHRTGTAVDLYVGQAPGLRPESTEDANRLHQSRTPAYRWLVANAGRFGFVPYVFEPWHWEWAGPPARPGA